MITCIVVIRKCALGSMQDFTQQNQAQHVTMGESVCSVEAEAQIT